MARGIVFDMDGLLVDSEGDWDLVRRRFVAEHSGTLTDDHARAMLGMNTAQWSAYLREQFSLPLTVAEIGALVIERRMERYGEHMVVMPGAIETVHTLAARYPLAVASSSPAVLIGFVLAQLDLTTFFHATASSDEVTHGKPSPDVYLLACERLGILPSEATAFEDSGNGILAAKKAGLRVIAVPNADFPPAPDSLAQADIVLSSLTEFRPEMVETEYSQAK